MRTTPGRVSLEEVAAHAGVSRATVSRVVNGVETVAPELRAKVEESIHELGYQPNLAARTLVTRRTDTIALVASEPDIRVFGDPFFSGIVRGATIEVGAAGLQLVIMMAQSAEDMGRLGRYIRSGAVDGVLMISEHESVDPLPPALQEAGIPLVIGGRPMQPGVTVPYVDNDNVNGARMAAAHLRSLGRTAIGTVAGPQDMTAGLDRLEGFREGLGEAFDPELVEPGDFTQKGGEAATARLLRRAPHLDALFAASDLTALGALKALRDAGRRVPEDVALVGFDDIEVAAYTAPPLTTVRQRTLLQGRTMARLLLARIRPDLAVKSLDGIPDVRGVHHVVLPVELVVRESTAPAPAP
ncbi:MAG: LacI family transcriptional regulator [Actinomycetales bacterium]|nr:LacI family transcriptional regulator [Actinomycetales bacterium]